MNPVFQSLNMTELNPENFDSELSKVKDQVLGVFFWGHDCPNCEVAKKMLEAEKDQVLSFDVRWFHVNTYHHMDLGVRFGLHGIPTFLFFKDGKRLGKISPFPGIDAFLGGLQKLF